MALSTLQPENTTFQTRRRPPPERGLLSPNPCTPRRQSAINLHGRRLSPATAIAISHLRRGDAYPPMASTSSVHVASPLRLRLRSTTAVPPGRVRVAAAPAASPSGSALSIAIDPLRLPRAPIEDSSAAFPVSPDKLDQWMRASVTEIVRGIESAPFLAYVFAGESVRLEKESVGLGDWMEIKRRREEDGGRVPDGVILVEELGGEDGAAAAAAAAMEAAERPRRMWGVLVQGRGRGAAECSACYILDTCRVRSSIGSSTHFSLVRANCFGDAAEVQLRKAWTLP